MAQQPRAAIVGSGFGVRVALPCLRAAGFVVTALGSRRARAIEADVRAQGVTRIQERWQDLVGDSDIDLMMIVTPPSLHAEMAIATLGGGHHLLCEKPLARTAAEAGRIRAAGVTADPRLLKAVDHELRFHPPFRRIRQLIRSDTIGAIRHITAHHSTATRLDPDIRWDWWSDADAGGGQLNALGSHLIDTLRWWLADEVVSAAGTLRTFAATRLAADGTPKAVTSDDYAAFTLVFSRGCQAAVVVSAMDEGNAGLHVEVTGERGSIRLDGFDRLSLTVAGTPPRDLTEVDPLAGRPVIGENPWRRALVRYGQHLAAVLAGTAAFEGATLDDGVQIQTVIDAVRTSAAVREISIA